ncbi:MAG: DUF1800 domain-containing protein [Longimicrobiales bacterium]
MLRRATYGVRAEDLAAILAMGGRDAWLDRQLHPARIQDDAVAERLEAFPTVSMSMDALLLEYAPLPRAARARADSMAAATTPPEAQRAAERERRRGRVRILPDLIGARLMRAVHSERQLEEVMTEFWFNHFNVFFAKGSTRYFLADYERSAIRPYVFGKFEKMLLATAQHPAMLDYLDNATSVVPDSMRPAGKRPRRRQRGLNENYARELLELHTLGVDGGYTQRDVVELARALTGWTFSRPNLREMQMMAAPQTTSSTDAAPENVAFVFRPATHDPGEKVVLGETLPAGRGIEDGVEVIRMLARHPSTAQHIATKLVERFVNDEPDPEFVEELADVFLETDGDLRQVTRALFTSERFYDSRNVGMKVKTPYELVTSALRVTRAEIAAPRALISTLRDMGNVPYSEPAPTGYPASSEDWVNAGAMLNRMSFGLKVAGGGIRGMRVDGFALAGVERGRDALQPERLGTLLDALLPGVPARELEDAIREDLVGRTGDGPGAQLARAVGLAIGSPEFQMR